MVGHHANVAYVSNSDSLKVHGSALLQALSIIKVGKDGDFGGEQSSGAAQKKYQNTQGHRSDSYGDADPEFRPFELLLAGQF